MIQNTQSFEPFPHTREKDTGNVDDGVVCSFVPLVALWRASAAETKMKGQVRTQTECERHLVAFSSKKTLASFFV